MKFHFSILFCLSFIFVLDFCVKANDLESVLSKYCISSLPGKGHCSTDREAHYESSKNRCRCGKEDSFTYNYWDKSTRLCKACAEGYIRNENTLSDCIKVQCPPGYGLEKVSKIECPSGNEVQYIHGGGGGSLFLSSKPSNAQVVYQCKVCPAGSYSSSSTGYKCKKCSKGTYSSSVASSSCSKCGKNQYTDVEGSTFCKSCSLGVVTDKYKRAVGCDCPQNYWCVKKDNGYDYYGENCGDKLLALFYGNDKLNDRLKFLLNIIKVNTFDIDDDLSKLESYNNDLFFMTLFVIDNLIAQYKSKFGTNDICFKIINDKKDFMYKVSLDRFCRRLHLGIGCVHNISNLSYYNSFKEMFHLYILNIVFAYSNHLRNSICVVDKSRVLDFNNISEKCDKFLSERLKNFDLDLLKDMREGSINQLSKKIIKFIKTEPYNVKSMFVNFVSYGDFSSYISTSGQPDTSYKSPCYIFKNSKIVQYKGIISELMCNPKNI